MGKRVSQAAVLVAVSMLVADAGALTQPDNTTIPQGSGLQDLFNSRGEAINALNDATTMPETFTPSCKLEFEVLLRNAGYQNSFGWYNVTGQKPGPGAMFEFLSCNDTVGVKKVLSIKQDPNYAKGDIGFYEAAGPGCPTAATAQNNFFSEKKYNPDGSQQNPYIHLIIYNSTVVKSAFYFAWEDLLSGGDNDFDDLVTFVTGITCTGGGGECQTGQPGVCGQGSLQCQNGKLECLPLSQPSAETCDGLDNDCDGVSDDDDDGPICPAEHVCDGGNCVPKCSGEFPCPPDEVCNQNGYCVDPECKDVTCPSGTKCVQGACKAPCDGVTCPYAQICLVGKCVDPCTKFTCDAEQLCHLGACVDKCGCTGCQGSDKCQPDGLCLPAACENVQCPEGSHCDQNGMCVDDCEGAVCPSGEICDQGQCVPDPNAGQGGEGQGGQSIDLGGGSPSGGAGGAAPSGGAGGGKAESSLDAPEEGGCGCEVVGRRVAGAGWLVALGLAAALRRRRQTARLQARH